MGKKSDAGGEQDGESQNGKVSETDGKEKDISRFNYSKLISTLKGETGKERKGTSPWRKGTATKRRIKAAGSQQGRKGRKPYLSITETGQDFESQ
ncbi:hypothetical protein NKR19_g4261 [Coniochaeta hoffmannii]|uniref:Uncharacterized protein n=1 Tax=Coniochaeta hoffmannii TaxID=91930 RepID=A0AA38S476_9PEZI|nr:hypothetical protein NKR19_g4261 [Coniochaeta hoffmannii]